MAIKTSNGAEVFSLSMSVHFELGDADHRHVVQQIADRCPGVGSKLYWKDQRALRGKRGS